MGKDYSFLNGPLYNGQASSEEHRKSMSESNEKIRAELDELRKEFQQMLNQQPPPFDKNGNPVPPAPSGPFRKSAKGLRGVQGQRPIMVFTDEAAGVTDEPFPAHDHVWTIVEIENNPIGVTCKVCDETRGVDPTSEKPIKTAFHIGGIYTVELGQGLANARLDNLNITGRTLEAQFTLHRP